MPYAITEMPALGYDLARSSYGARAAEVLRTALHADADDLRRLAQHGRQGASTPREVVAEDALLTRLSERAGGSADAWGSREELVHRLETAFIGSLDSADRLVRTEFLDWVPRDDEDPGGLSVVATKAADVLRDAVAPAFRPHSTAASRRLAAGLAQSGVRLVGVAAPVGPPGVDALPAAGRAMDEAQRATWREAIESVRHTTITWEPAMAQAGHALRFTNRVRQGADAQLAAVLAFHAAGFTPRDATYGGWQALSGAVRATMVEDVLQRRNITTLTRVVREALA